MKGRRLLASIITLIAVLGITIGQTVSYATLNESFFVALAEYRKNNTPNTAYAIGDPTALGGAYIMDLISYASADATSSTDKDLYCVKAGVGDGWRTQADNRVEYKLGYDVKTEKSAIEGLRARSENYSNIAGANYNQILWVTDNMYIPGTGNGKSTSADREALLKAAGINDSYYTYKITDDDIEVVQQMALWYFTNGEDLYHKENLQMIRVNNSDLSSYTALTTYREERAEQMDMLYDYLLEKNATVKNSGKYNSTTNELGAPVSITLGADELKIINGKVGPIKITKNNDLPYSIEISLNDSKITDASSFVDENGNVIDLDSYVGNLYVKLPSSFDVETDNAKLDIDLNYKTTKSTLWIPGTSNTEQPIIEVEKVPHKLSFSFETGKPAKFDLALRKFISAISSDSTFSAEDYLTGDASRAPQITGAWREDEETTLVKNHSKTPLKVKNGDYIEYTIRVYNEGELAGYADEITDYILNNTGLEFVADHPTNTTYEWTKDGNKIKTTYLSKAKSTTERNNLLNAYDGNVSNLSSKDVKIVFKVNESNASTSNNTLVNIAEISKAKDKDGNDMNDTGDDRDSTPNYDKKGYPNPEYDTENHEDDIDYEPVELKQFDLALRKFIAAISSDETFEEGDYLTGEASREPVLPGTWRTDEPTTLVKNHDKNPLSVKSGDYVLYTIRVYNEGEVDGYASLIKDNIPDGLEYVTTHEINTNNYWTTHTNTSGKVDYVTTDWLAKGNGAEVGSVEGDAKYTANLLKALKKNSDGSVTVGTEEGNLNPDYRDVQVVLKVTEPNTSTRTLTNFAQVSGATDKDGNELNEPGDDIDSTPDNGYSHNEDDEDFEPVVLKTFDLSLRKFITAIDGTTLSAAESTGKTYEREPVVDTTSLVEGTTATYNHTKAPKSVKKGSTVVYTLRVYNEGTTDGYASQITDFLPAELEFIPAGTGEGQSKINQDNGWSVVEGSNGRRVVTSKLADTKLNARTENPGDTSNPYTLSCQSIQIECKVKDDVTVGQKITNIAEITEYKDEKKEVINPDRDSKSNSLTDGDSSTGTLPTDEQLPTYKDDEISKAYIPGQQDDDDFEKIVIEKEKYDLALRKFITSVNEIAVDSREPVIGEWSLDKKADSDEYTTAAKTHSKTPVAVSTGDTVKFTIRVYNEGNAAGTATQITDYLPSGLEFIPAGTGEGQSKVNQDNGWQVVDGSNGKKVTTAKLAGETIIPVMKRPEMIGGLGLDEGVITIVSYKDVEIECKVVATKVDGHNLRNLASITGDNGEDEDSNPENNPENDDDYPTSSTPQGKGEEDDDDFEEVRMKTVDFALRKYISKVGETETNRTPVPDVSKLIPNGTEQTAEYKHPKTPLAVGKGSNLVYTIRVYNEGEADGFVGKITDYLPENLEFVENSEINTQYGWKKNENGSYYTEYLAKPKVEPGQVSAQVISKNLIKAFDGTTLDYKDVQIECKVKDSVKVGDKLTNIAEISRYENANGDIVNPDRDSTSSNVNIPEDLPGYKDDEINKEYVPGQEDDDDFEKVYIPKFDLALRKFITNVNGTEETSRIPQVDASKLASGESTTATYTHPKEPVNVVAGDVVVYTIRVYNEGEIDGYAAEVEDDIPNHLTFLADNEVNTSFGWKMYDEQGNETTDASKAVKIKTTYLSKENETSERTNLIKAFNPNAEASDTNPDHKEVKVAFQVNTTAEPHKVITNYAQIDKNEDEDGTPVDDIDSTPGEWVEGEDDQDIENIIPSVFDLSLIKFVSQVQVTEDGNTRTTNTGNVGNHDTDIIPKVEVNKKKLNSTVVKFIYTIRVFNEGDIAGYAKEVTDYIPEGLEFKEADNPNWTVKSDGAIATRALENTLLQPGESAPVTVVFTWINGADNLNLKRNWAEISEDYNDKHVPDRDSTPNNRVEGEDDIDFADVLLSIKTGKAPVYILLGGTILLVLAGGILLIKKYVL